MNKELVIKRRVDLGRSHVRTFDALKTFTIEPSAYKEIEKDAPIRKDITDAYNDFEILAAGRANIVGKRFVKGQAMSAFKGSTNQADNQSLKVDQEETYVNFTYAVARAAIDLYKESNLPVTETVVLATDLGVCLPTAEYYTQSGEKLKEELSGKYIVRFPVKDESVCFEVTQDGLVIAPEGPTALAPAFDGEQADILEDEIGIILDVGYGSTDETLVVNGEPQGDTARSLPYGGITLESAVESALGREGYSSSATSVQLAIKHGYVKEGNVERPVGHLVAECKRRFADKLKQSAISLLTESFYQAADLSYYFPAGRSFKDPEDDHVSTYYTGELCKLFESAWDRPLTKIENIELDDSYRCIDRTAPMRDGKYPSIKPDIYELANVFGLSNLLDDEDEDEIGNELIEDSSTRENDQDNHAVTESL